MDNKRLIVDLIRQDMKHNQLVLGLEKLGFSGEYFHSLEIIHIVAQLMGIKERNIEDEWYDTYFSFMHKVNQYEIDPKGENLRELAQSCYETLYALTR